MKTKRILITKTKNTNQFLVEIDGEFHVFGSKKEAMYFVEAQFIQ